MKLFISPLPFFSILLLSMESPWRQPYQEMKLLLPRYVSSKCAELILTSSSCRRKYCQKPDIVFEKCILYVICSMVCECVIGGTGPPFHASGPGLINSVHAKLFDVQFITNSN